MFDDSFINIVYFESWITVYLIDKIFYYQIKFKKIYYFSLIIKDEICVHLTLYLFKKKNRDLNFEISSNWLVLIWTNIDVEAEYWK